VTRHLAVVGPTRPSTPPPPPSGHAGAAGASQKPPLRSSPGRAPLAAPAETGAPSRGGGGGGGPPPPPPPPPPRPPPGRAPGRARPPGGGRGGGGAARPALPCLACPALPCLGPCQWTGCQPVAGAPGRSGPRPHHPHRQQARQSQQRRTPQELRHYMVRNCSACQSAAAGPLAQPALRRQQACEFPWPAAASTSSRMHVMTASSGRAGAVFSSQAPDKQWSCTAETVLQQMLDSTTNVRFNGFPPLPAAGQLLTAQCAAG